MASETEVAIVTGGAGGIGEAAARAIGGRGARVALADLRPSAAEEAAAGLQADGLDIQPFTVDVGSEASVRAMVASVLWTDGGASTSWSTMRAWKAPSLSSRLAWRNTSASCE